MFVARLYRSHSFLKNLYSCSVISLFAMGRDILSILAVTLCCAAGAGLAATACAVWICKVRYVSILAWSATPPGVTKSQSGKEQ